MYGLLKSSASNLGDDIQSAVVQPLLPRIDRYLDFDFLGEITSSQKIKMIIHGCCRPKSWPPSPVIIPLITSYNIADTAQKKLTSEKSINYFKEYEPIGCRDYFTYNLLESKGVKVYFSGCITFMLNKWEGAKTDDILAVDLDSETIKHLPDRAIAIHHGSGITTESIANILYKHSHLLHKTIKATRVHMVLNDLHQMFTRLRENEGSINRRFARAKAILEKYREAKLVVTSRLHCALPCIAFGTPVILVHKNLKDIRFSGLLRYVRAYSINEFKHKINEINFDNPLPNPKPIDALRNNLITTCKEFLEEK